jgi:hypothetical protein
MRREGWLVMNADRSTASGSRVREPDFAQVTNRAMNTERFARGTRRKFAYLDRWGCQGS